MKKLFILPKTKFNLDHYICYNMSIHFYRDSVQHRNLAHYLLSHSDYSHNLTYRAKAFTFLLMSTECLLKVVYINSSYDIHSPANLYKVMKAKIGHKPYTAFQQFIKPNGSKFRIKKSDLANIEKAEKFGIHFRYNLELFLVQSTFSMAEILMGLDEIENDIGGGWILDFYKTTNSIDKNVRRFSKSRLGKYATVRGDYLMNYENQISKFIRDIKSK